MLTPAITVENFKGISDPVVRRIINQSNWTGVGVVFQHVSFTAVRASDIFATITRAKIQYLLGGQSA